MARKQTGGFEGYFASLLLQDGGHMECRLKKWVPGEITVCINCGLVPSTLYNLQCSHKLCQACFRKESFYVCPMENAKSEQYKEHMKTRHPEIAHKMNPLNPENKRPSAIGPPPGFGGYVSPIGRGRGLLSTKADAFRRGHEEFDSQEIAKSTQVPSCDTLQEDMETEGTPQAMDSPAGDGSQRREEDTTTKRPCLYCAFSVRSDERKEHLNNCSDVFFRWKTMIKNAVWQDCQNNQFEWQSKSFGHVCTCPALELECQRSFVLMMWNYSREHCTDECPASNPVHSCFQEHVGICPKFSMKCSEFVSRVVDKYRHDHSNNRCPGNRKTTGSTQVEADHFKSEARSPHGKTEQEAGEIDQCPNCFVSLKIQDVADHADNCPKLLVCETCSSHVLAKDYGKHLDDECPANKQSCRSSQVDEDKDQISTKPASYGAKNRAPDFVEGALPCPYCETLWENKDLQEHIKNCQRDHFEALNSPSGKTDGRHPGNSLFQESKDTRSIKETKEGHEKPMETEDDVEALKKRVEALEQRIENLERPLRRLIERLRNNE
ncbi:uncharacterized protein LOC144142292 isoform X3 [Haemaphysalis longicornis]